MPSVVQYRHSSHYRQPRPAIRASSPPTNHNAPVGEPVLTPEEAAAVAQAREALAAVKRSFEYWVVLARGLAVLRHKADALGGYFTFAYLRQREGFGGLHRSTVHLLIRLDAKIAEVERWRASLTEREKFRWSGPQIIVRRCPAFAQPKPARRAKPLRLEPTDSSDDIAAALVEAFLPRKAEAIARAVLCQLKAREAASRRAPLVGEPEPASPLTVRSSAPVLHR